MASKYYENTNMLPVYVVVVEPMTPNSVTLQFQILTIIKVIECDLADWYDVSEKEIAPLRAQGRNIYAHMFFREVSNPFKDAGMRTPVTFEDIAKLLEGRKSDAENR